MSEIETQTEADEDEGSFEREASVSRYPGCDPVMVRTTRLAGEEPSREERMRAGVHRLAQEGRINSSG